MAEGATDSIACSAPDASLIQPSNTAFNTCGRKPQKPRPKKDIPPKIRPRVNARTFPRLIHFAEAEPASPDDGTTRPMASWDELAKRVNRCFKTDEMKSCPITAGYEYASSNAEGGANRPAQEWEAWVFIHKVGFLRLRRIMAEVDGLFNPGCSRNAPPVYCIASRIATRAWLKNYFDPKHGRTEKITNPSSDRE
eukprot:jgi/Tetstr1/462942/TSEL_007890.t1